MFGLHAIKMLFARSSHILRMPLGPFYDTYTIELQVANEENVLFISKTIHTWKARLSSTLLTIN